VSIIPAGSGQKLTGLLIAIAVRVETSELQSAVVRRTRPYVEATEHFAEKILEVVERGYPVSWFTQTAESSGRRHILN
jgi:hypothetical protein